MKLSLCSCILHVSLVFIFPSFKSLRVMTKNKKIFRLAVLLSVLGIGALHIYSLSLEPKYMSIDEIGEDDLGSFVEIEGHIRDIYFTRNENIVLELVNIATGGNISIYIYVRNEDRLKFTELIPGAKVRVCGKVEEYGDSIEIKVDSINNLEILQSAEQNEVAICTLLKSP